MKEHGTKVMHGMMFIHHVCWESEEEEVSATKFEGKVLLRV